MGLLSPLGSIDLLIICPGGRGGRPEGWSPPFFCLFFNRMVVGMALGGDVALIFRISVVRGGLFFYYRFLLGTVTGGGGGCFIHIICSE